MRNIIVMSRNNHRYASRENYDSALQQILPATVPWFTSNRFARKSNYPRGEHAEKPRIKKHWDLRKISARYKSRPPRNLLFLVPIPHSLSAAVIGGNRRGLSLVKRTNASTNLYEIPHFSSNRKNDSNVCCWQFCDRETHHRSRETSTLIVDHHRGSRAQLPFPEAIDTWTSTEILYPGEEEHLNS